MITSNPIQILLKDRRDIDIIKSPMKYEILNLLRYREMNFDEIVENTCKSKASVSMHLRDLRQAGIVNYKADPYDNRKKIFYLTVDFLGSINSNNIRKEHENQTQRLIDEFIEKGDVEFPVLLMNPMKSLLIEFGMDFTPVMEKLGNYMGQYLFSQLYDEDFEIFIDNISSYWLKNNLGQLCFNATHKIEITCMDCFESLALAKSGNASCNLEKGIFHTLFEKYFKMDLNIKETMCYCAGDEKCVFELQP